MVQLMKAPKPATQALQGSWTPYLLMMICIWQGSGRTMGQSDSHWCNLTITWALMCACRGELCAYLLHTNIHRSPNTKRVNISLASSHMSLVCLGWLRGERVWNRGWHAVIIPMGYLYKEQGWLGWGVNCRSLMLTRPAVSSSSWPPPKWADRCCHHLVSKEAWRHMA